MGLPWWIFGYRRLVCAQWASPRRQNVTAGWINRARGSDSSLAPFVSLYDFATSKAGEPAPALAQTHSVIPGISTSSGLSPIIRAETYLKLTSWLGRRSDPAPGLFQQWGLPAHYFCGFHRNAETAHPGALREHLSDPYCCGLADERLGINTTIRSTSVR